jgi:hypothetical protein
VEQIASEEKLCTCCQRYLSLDKYYTKGPGEWSSSCIACELARKKQQWLKRKKKNARTKSCNGIEVKSCKIIFSGTPDWDLVREKFKDLNEESEN